MNEAPRSQGGQQVSDQLITVDSPLVFTVSRCEVIITSNKISQDASGASSSFLTFVGAWSLPSPLPPLASSIPPASLFSEVKGQINPPAWLGGPMGAGTSGLDFRGATSRTHTVTDTHSSSPAGFLAVVSHSALQRRSSRQSVTRKLNRDFLVRT